MIDILVICDGHDDAVPLFDYLTSAYNVEKIDVRKMTEARANSAHLMLVDCNLTSKSARFVLKSIFSQTRHLNRTLFLTSGGDFSSAGSSKSGGSRILSKSLPVSRAARVIRTMLTDTGAIEESSLPAAVTQVLDNSALVNQKIAAAIRSGSPLPRRAVEQVSGQIVTVLDKFGIDIWLQSVEQYHCVTYRHCMTVTGYATAFGQHMGLAEEDIQLLAISGLMHDVGKVRIPLEILNKPGKLTSEEFELIKLHPVYSREILERDGQFDKLIVDAAGQHHEYLDGSGYPDGLAANRIGPLVRMITIADIFAALSERRAYKEPFPPEKAYAIMDEMGGKLDQQLLRHFRPLVIANDFAKVRKAKSAKAPVATSLTLNRHPLEGSLQAAG